MRTIQNILCLGILLAGTPSFAASVAVSSDAAVSPKTSEVPQALLSLLVDSGIPIVATSEATKFTLTANNIHCDYRSNSALDIESPYSGIATSACRINSEDAQDSTLGEPFAEGRALVTLLSTVEDSTNEVYFNDCGMGRCTTFVKSIECTIDTKIESYSSGRFVCVLTDGQSRD